MIRVAVVRTLCMGSRGYGYSIDVNSMRADDTVIESDGLKLVVDRESLRRLRGAHIDYEESLQDMTLLEEMIKRSNTLSGR